MNEEKIKEVFSDEEFVKSLLALETPEEVQKALAEKDVDLSVDEIKKVAELLQKKAEGTLNDEELEAVAGGSSLIAGIAFGIVYVVTVATGVGVVVNEGSRRGWRW